MKRILAYLLSIIMLVSNINVTYALDDSSTIINITNLASGSETSHDCNKYLVNKYDANQHWQECSLCGKIIGNKYNHSFSTIGKAGCDGSTGYQYNLCDCGYSVQLPKKEHTENSSWIGATDRYCHFKHCTTCGGWTKSEYCTNAYGQRLGCATGISGTCSVCGLYRDASKHALLIEDVINVSINGTTITYEGNIVCLDCRKVMGTYSIVTYKLSSTQSKAILNMTTYINIPSVTIGCGNCSFQKNGVFQITSYTQNGNNIKAEALINYNYNVLSPGRYEVHFNTSLIQSTSFVGNCTYIHVGGNFITDWDAPTYINSNINYSNSINGFATKANLTINYNETYDSLVYVRVLDSDQSTVISDWSSMSQNGTTFSKTIDLINEISGNKTIYVQAKDTSNNTSSLTPITITNLDSKAPIPTSFSNTNTNWSKTKTFVASAIDNGSGNILIAFNNVNNYLASIKNNNTYSKSYTLVGDIYGDTKAAIYYKDAVGNEATQFITISNIDNTPPTITQVSTNKNVGYNTLTISANDFNSTLNKSGSGVTKYAISTSNVAPSSGWQTSNVFNVTIPNTYYIFAKDLVGNISSSYKVNVNIDYTLTINPNSGIWNNSSTSQSFTMTNGNTKTIANPSKVGYTFTNWTLNGSNASFSNNTFTMGSSNASLVANYSINQYDVTYIDVVDNINGTQLGKTTKKVNYNSNVRGSDLGSNTSDNAYYNGYYYVSDTSAIVSTNGATVYRIFKLRTLNKTSNLNWNDNNNKNGLRPSKYTLKLLKNGEVFKQVELSSTQTSYTYSNLNKYDSNGKAYTYTFQVDANSDRYKMSIDRNGNIIENYQNSTFSVIIPKSISLNGNTGKGSYNIKVDGTFYYNDTLTVIPSNSFKMIDKSGISNINASVTQNTTTFTKSNLANTKGTISLSKAKFAGSYTGTFNFIIKFTMKN